MGGAPPWSGQVEGFEWDSGNRGKNWEKHAVSDAQAEEVFFNHPLLFLEAKPSELETRFLLLGRTLGGRRVAVVFTVRGRKIRVISARDMSRRERKVYEKDG